MSKFEMKLQKWIAVSLGQNNYDREGRGRGRGGGRGGGGGGRRRGRRGGNKSFSIESLTLDPKLTQRQPNLFSSV